MSNKDIDTLLLLMYLYNSEYSRHFLWLRGQPKECATPAPCRYRVTVGVELFIFGDDGNNSLNKSVIKIHSRSSCRGSSASSSLPYRTPALCGFRNAQYSLIRTLDFLKTVKWNTIVSWNLEVVDGKNRLLQPPLPSMRSWLLEESTLTVFWDDIYR
jgi:hypothetical protein